MSRIIFLFVVLFIAVAVAFPADGFQPPGLQRITKVTTPEINRVKRGFGGYGRFGLSGGFGLNRYKQGGFGRPGGCYGCGGGYRGYRPFGGGSFSNSAANAGSVSSPFGSASYANSFANSGSRGYGR